MPVVNGCTIESENHQPALPVRDLPLIPAESATVEPQAEPPDVPEEREPPRRGRLPEVAEGAPVADATPSPETAKPASPRDTRGKQEE